MGNGVSAQSFQPCADLAHGDIGLSQQFPHREEAVELAGIMLDSHGQAGLLEGLVDGGGIGIEHDEHGGATLRVSSYGWNSFWAGAASPPGRSARLSHPGADLARPGREGQGCRPSPAVFAVLTGWPASGGSPCRMSSSKPDSLLKPREICFEHLP